MSSSDFSDSDESNDIELEKHINKDNNYKKVYQLQHDKDELFKFRYMGLFEKLPVVNLGDFNIEGIHYFLTSHFVFLDDINVSENNDMIDMITLNINKNGKLSYLSVGIEFNDKIDIENLNQGSVYLRYVSPEKNINEIVKKNLFFPGSTKIIYFLVRELKNDKIQSYINE